MLDDQQKKHHKAFESVKRDLEDTLSDCEEKTKVIQQMKEIGFEQEETIKLLKLKMQGLTNDSEKKHLKNAADQKHLAKENTELRDKIKDKNSELKTLRKEHRDSVQDFENISTKMKDTLEHLNKFKSLKLEEEKVNEKATKELKIRLKTLEESKLKTNIKSSQTDQHPEIPYKITSPLPPIFSSQLCFSTPPIHFLSRSLPQLDKFKWCQPEEYMVDDADEYLNDQYDQEIEDFYLEAREDARTRRCEKS